MSEEKIAELENRVSTLEGQVTDLFSKVLEYDELIAQVQNGIDQAKKNPMVGNMMKMFGV